MLIWQVNADDSCFINYYAFYGPLYYFFNFSLFSSYFNKRKLLYFNDLHEASKTLSAFFGKFSSAKNIVMSRMIFFMGSFTKNLPMIGKNSVNYESIFTIGPSVHCIRTLTQSFSCLNLEACILVLRQSVTS